MEQRTDWVDYAKAIGIILVVYAHVARGLFNAGISMPPYLYELLDSIIYSFHMPLFFFLSGLFFYQSFESRGAGRLILSKIDTIFYPYIIWSILQGTIEVGLSGYSNGNVTFDEVFSLLWFPRAHFWFLYTLFGIFIISAILFTLFSRKASVSIFFIAATIHVYNPVIPNAFIINLILQNLVFFCFGVIFNQYIQTEKLLLPYIIGILLSCIFSQWFFHQYLLLNYTDKGFASLLLACISIMAIVILSLYLSSKRWHFLVMIGSSSLAIYLMHILAASGTRIILQKVLDVDSFIIHILVGCFLGIAAPLLGLLIIHRFNIPYCLSAPISHGLINIYNLTLKKK